ncbi:hypothetical protein Pcinc_013857 [Petrolisthes cinctipes]|uniref:Uncharacterized protein n=1 Tax=Petrolisthes cinctipes TaxID=88211 RepID=A0AAE1FYX0_PETCI|nr:hypothetical protein Pcinc_013857 [Petrolisthes cinctipes]
MGILEVPRTLTITVSIPLSTSPNVSPSVSPVILSSSLSNLVCLTHYPPICLTHYPPYLPHPLIPLPHPPSSILLPASPINPIPPHPPSPETHCADCRIPSECCAVPPSACSPLAKLGSAPRVDRTHIITDNTHHYNIMSWILLPTIITTTC